jgi:hypothetical protein
MILCDAQTMNEEPRMENKETKQVTDGRLVRHSLGDGRSASNPIPLATLPSLLAIVGDIFLLPLPAR